MKKLITVFVTTLLLATASLSWAGPVNINSADATTLAANIKGIGQKKADAIVAFREQHGSFSRAEDLSKVKGIGKRTVEKNLDNLKVD